MMKKYCVNKNFIPCEFINKKSSIIEKENRRSIIILFLLVLFLLPNSMTYLFKNTYFKDNTYVENQKNSFNTNINNESFYKWMDIIKDDVVGTFNNESATIYVDGFDKLKEFLKNEDIVVTNVEDIGDRKYKVQINNV